MQPFFEVNFILSDISSQKQKYKPYLELPVKQVVLMPLSHHPAGGSAIGGSFSNRLETIQTLNRRCPLWLGRLFRLMFDFKYIRSEKLRSIVHNFA